MLVTNHNGGLGSAEVFSFAVRYLERFGTERPLVGMAHPFGFSPWTPPRHAEGVPDRLGPTRRLAEPLHSPAEDLAALQLQDEEPLVRVDDDEVGLALLQGLVTVSLGEPQPRVGVEDHVLQARGMGPCVRLAQAKGPGVDAHGSRG